MNTAPAGNDCSQVVGGLVQTLHQVSVDSISELDGRNAKAQPASLLQGNVKKRRR